MATRLSELTDFLKTSSEARIVEAKQFNYLQTGKVKLDGDVKEYDISAIAVQHLSKMLGIPAFYINRIPDDLRSVNLNYMLSRNSSLNLYVAFSDGIISEVKDGNNERTTESLLRSVSEMLDYDPYVIQADISEKGIRFMIYSDKTKFVGGAQLKKGFALWCPADVSSNFDIEPAYVDDIDETAIIFDVSEQFLEKYDSEDRQDLKTVFSFAMNMTSHCDDVIDSRSDDVVKDFEHFASHEGASCGVRASNRRKVVEEASLIDSDKAVDLALAVMKTQQRVSNMVQVYRLGELASEAFFASDPVFCKACHQEIEHLDEDIEDVQN